MSKDPSGIFNIKASAWTNKSQSLYNQEIYNSERGVSTWGMMIFPVCFLSKKAKFWHCFLLDQTPLWI